MEAIFMESLFSTYLESDFVCDAEWLEALRQSQMLLCYNRRLTSAYCHSPTLIQSLSTSLSQSRVCGPCPLLNRLTPNDPYTGLTAPLTSKRCILYIYSTNIGTEYFKHALYSPFFSLQNAVCFTTLTCLVPVLFSFYIQGVLKLKKIIPAPKG